MTNQNSEPLCIVAAALRVNGVIVSAPQPARHGDLFSALNSFRRRELEVKPSDQGFLTNTGKFASREEAKRIAFEAEQLLPRHHPGPELYSEDLW